MLMDNLEVTSHDMYTVNGPLDLLNLMDLLRLDRPDLKDPLFYPTTPPPLAKR